MIGAIIGDIVGSRWEFNPTNDYNFEWMSDKNGFTDDTICTVAVADAGVVDTPTPWEAMVAGFPNGCKATIHSHTIVSAMELL